MASAAAVIAFLPFRLDPVNEQLWRGKELLPLRPKPFAILRYLVEHPERLVTKDELLRPCGPGPLSASSYSTPISEICARYWRRPAAPRFIATVVRRGYRSLPLSRD